MKTFYLVALFLLFISCGKPDTRESTIGIQGFGNVNQSLLDTIKVTIEEVYHFDRVITLETRALPHSAFVNIKSPRYRADSILRILKREKPDSVDYVIGILNKDISTTKRDGDGNVLKPVNKYNDWGIFGLGYQPGVSCVLSTYRIKSSDEGKFVERMKKVCMHEIGHNLGLDHCTNELCVMRDAAESIKTVDQVELKLCNQCFSMIN